VLVDFGVLIHVNIPADVNFCFCCVAFEAVVMKLITWVKALDVFDYCVHLLRSCTGIRTLVSGQVQSLVHLTEW
jgi:hypothetical protein